MQVQIDFWQLLMAIGGLVGSFGTIVWLGGKALIGQFEKRLVERFKTIQDDLTKRASEDAEVAKQIRQFETDFLIFQRDLPNQYVRREDYIRGQSVLEAKQDALFSKMELVRVEVASMKGANYGS